MRIRIADSEVVAHGRHAGGRSFLLDDGAVACLAGEVHHADIGAGRPVLIQLVLPACGGRITIDTRLGLVLTVAAAGGLFRADAEISAVVVAAATVRVGTQHETVALADGQCGIDAKRVIHATVFLPGNGEVHVAADCQLRGDFLVHAEVGERAAFDFAHALEFFRADFKEAVVFSTARVGADGGGGARACLQFGSPSPAKRGRVGEGV